MPTAIIADDERLMRDQLRLRLSEAWPELEILGEAKNGEEAVPAQLWHGDRSIQLTLHLGPLTREERDIILSGCLINYYAKR